MEPTAEQVIQELENESTTHQRRLEIGGLLAEAGDTRAGVGVVSDIPDVVWLPVMPGGIVSIERRYWPESPDEEEKIVPVGDFEVEPFFISKYLMTIIQYRAFIAAADGLQNPEWWHDMPQAYQHQLLDSRLPTQDNLPQSGLSWYQCIAFARWLNHKLEGLELHHPTEERMLGIGKNAQVRLPSECEWQWAAQNGAESRDYPWGAAKSDCANTAESGLKQPTPVGMYPHGAAACGAMDMAGNLMEWCANDKADVNEINVMSPESKALRGGDWAYSIRIASCLYVDDELPHRMDPLNGCRLIVAEKHTS